MKNLIFVNGTMGVGKTTVCKELSALLPSNVFLDGDWCWQMNPFVVTDETKVMVLENIAFLLNNFIRCSVCDNIIFCWVMDNECIIHDICSRLSGGYSLNIFTLTCSESALTERLTRDIQNDIREVGIIERSLARIHHYNAMKTTKINTTNNTPRQAAEKIIEHLL